MRVLITYYVLLGKGKIANGRVIFLSASDGDTCVTLRASF